jgi:hypothetical protein
MGTDGPTNQRTDRHSVFSIWFSPVKLFKDMVLSLNNIFAYVDIGFFTVSNAVQHIT